MFLTGRAFMPTTVWKIRPKLALRRKTSRNPLSASPGWTLPIRRTWPPSPAFLFCDRYATHFDCFSDGAGFQADGEALASLPQRSSSYIQCLYSLPL